MQTHKAARHVATCQAVSRLHCCDSRSVFEVSLCRRWSSGNCTHIITRVITDIMSCVCVCFPSCSGVLLWLDVDTFLSFSVTLIIFEGSVMAEVYLVFYLVVLKMLSLVGGLCTFIHFVVLFDWLQKHNNITAFLFLVFLLKNRNNLFYTYSHTHYLIFIEQIMY